MIELRRDIKPSDNILKKLEAFQDEIDRKPSFSEKSELAKTMFPRKNTKTNPVFREVKKYIAEMCNSTRRCVYCEDSLADEVEHIYPKDIYPEKCFKWENYVYACGPCNGPKNNKFAIFRNSDGRFQAVNPPRGASAVRPPAGEAVLINPRAEDPLRFAMLDLSGTFLFTPVKMLSTGDIKRMRYTYDEVMRLNQKEREPIRQARENAFGNYKDRLYAYVKRKKEGASTIQLNRMIENLKKENHPTVWKEMQRQHKMGLLKGIDKELDDLFLAEPTAVNW